MIIENNFFVRKGKLFFGNSKLLKMAGNSIVIKVLEAIFEQIVQIDKKVLSFSERIVVREDDYVNRRVI